MPYLLISKSNEQHTTMSAAEQLAQNDANRFESWQKHFLLNSSLCCPESYTSQLWAHIQMESELKWKTKVPSNSFSGWQDAGAGSDGQQVILITHQILL